MTNKEDFSVTSFTEIKTATNQIFTIQCRSDDIPKIKELSKLIYDITLPLSKKINSVSHGSFGRFSRFDIEQKKYAGGEGGYIECLKINNPPDNRNGNIVHHYNYGSSKFYEFRTIENAMNAWKYSWNRLDDTDENLINSDGCIRKVNCGITSPWFYAIANQILYGDFAFPIIIEKDHPIYRPFKKFLVIEEKYNPEKDVYGKVHEVKTCIDYTEKECKSNFYENYTEYTIYWDDGTYWVGTSLKEAPKPINDNRLLYRRRMDDYIKKDVQGQV